MAVPVIAGCPSLPGVGQHSQEPKRAHCLCLSAASGQWEGKTLIDISVFSSPLVICTWPVRRWGIVWYLCIPITFCLLHLANEKVRHWLISLYSHNLSTSTPGQWESEALCPWYLCIPITFICLLHLTSEKVRHCVIPLYSQHLYFPSAPGQWEGEALHDTSVFPSPLFAFCTWPMRRWGIAWYLYIPITFGFICLLHLASEVRHCVIPLYSYYLYLPSAAGQWGETLCDTSVFLYAWYTWVFLLPLSSEPGLWEGETLHDILWCADHLCLLNLACEREKCCMIYCGVPKSFVEPGLWEGEMCDTLWCAHHLCWIWPVWGWDVW